MPGAGDSEAVQTIISLISLTIRLAKLIQIIYFANQIFHGDNVRDQQTVRRNMNLKFFSDAMDGSEQDSLLSTGYQCQIHK